VRSFFSVCLILKSSRTKGGKNVVDVRNAVGKIAAKVDAETKTVEILDRWHQLTVIQFNDDGTVTVTSKSSK